jgi:hypothetical protein
MEQQGPTSGHSEFSIPRLRLEIFHAGENPEKARAYCDGFQKKIKAIGVKGLKSADVTWLDRPDVWVMSLWSGQKMVAGSRIELHDDKIEFPIIDVLRVNSPENLGMLEQMNNTKYAEWCGLWVSGQVKGLGISALMADIGLATAHSLGLDWVISICPRHTVDLFRELGFRLWTHNDKPVKFAYPTSAYDSYLLKLRTDNLELSSIRAQKTVSSYLNNQVQHVYTRGKLGDAHCALCPFLPKVNLTNVIRQVELASTKGVKKITLPRS